MLVGFEMISSLRYPLYIYTYIYSATGNPDKGYTVAIAKCANCVCVARSLGAISVNNPMAIHVSLLGICWAARIGKVL